MLNIIYKQDFSDFDFMPEANKNFSLLTSSQVKKVENYLNEVHPLGVSADDLDRYFSGWKDALAQDALGYDDWDALVRHNLGISEVDEPLEIISDEELDHLFRRKR